MTLRTCLDGLSLVFACDSFKGTISSARAAQLLEASATRILPGARCLGLTVADGGEGTAVALAQATGGRLVGACVTDPVGRHLKASYALLPYGQAVIEMAAASGLTLVAGPERDPLTTSTYGTGQLILDALDRGARDITLALGGSATNDGGMGMARALGARLLDQDGCELEGRGADLARVAAIDASALDPRLGAASFHALCDVDNPLLGPRGATRVFGPQKGAGPEALNLLESGMRAYAHLLAEVAGFDVSQVPGAGAAGGLGAASLAYLGADLVPGIDRILDLMAFDDLLAQADLVVTGEGHADGQSVHGKVVGGVGRRCRRAGVPCLALVGGMNPDATALLGLGVDALVPTVIDAGPLDEALGRAEENFSLAADRVFSLIRIGALLDDAEPGD